MRYAALIALLLTASTAQASSITDLSRWTLLEDPPHPGLSATVDGPSQATLSASGGVPASTDIGFASVNGPDVSGSTAGFYFDARNDFLIAIDFALSGLDPVGLGGIGFGVGRDVAGRDSAGIALGFLNDIAVAYAPVARVGDVTQPLSQTLLELNQRLPNQGRFFIDYDASSDRITVGVSSPGSAGPGVAVGSFDSLIDRWGSDQLLVSFFLRSEAAGPFSGIVSGDLDAVFSNFEVLSGTPISIPEPGSAALMSLALAGCLSRRR